MLMREKVGADLYQSKSGEITSKDALIAEIESLLNAFPTASQTTLSFAVMNVLSCADLEQIRDHLLQKRDDVIARNSQWLKGLTND